MLENTFNIVLNMSITAVVTAAVVMGIRFVLHDRLPKVFSYALWGIVFIRLLMPFSFSAIFSIYNLFPTPPAVYTVESSNRIGIIEYIPDNIGLMKKPEVNLGYERINNVVNNLLPAATPAVAVNPMQIIMALATFIWILGAFSILVYSILLYLRTTNSLKTAVLCKDNTMITDISHRLKLKRKVELFTSETVTAPIVYGLIKPRIILPFSLTQGGKDTAVEQIITHGLVHIKRLDHIVKPLSVLVLCIHWFNPVVWFSFILSQKDMEISCDERVLRIFDTDAGSSYAEALAGFSAVQDSFLNGGILALGENYLKRRIKNVGGYKKHGYMASITAVVVFLVLGALLLTNQTGFYRIKEVKDKGNKIISQDLEVEAELRIPVATYNIVGDETPAVRAIMDFYKGKNDPIVVYEEIPFEEGTLVLAERIMDGEHYPDLHFIDDSGKVTYLTRGSYCWTLNYTQFKGYQLFFGLAGVEMRTTGKSSIPIYKPVQRVEAVFEDKVESAIPREEIIHINPKENDTRVFKNPQGYIIPVKDRRMPDNLAGVLEGGERVSLSQISIEFNKEYMPDYLQVKNAHIYNSFAFTFTPMLRPVEWEQGYMEGKIKFEGKTDKNGNLNALYFRPAGHMSHLDSFIVPQDIKSFYLANNSIWTGKFSAGETVQVIYPEERELLDCRILRLTFQMVDKEVGQDRLTIMETNEKGQLVLPGESGDYILVLRTEKDTKIQTYVGILEID